MGDWSFEPTVIAGIGILLIAYVAGVILPRRASVWKMVSFVAGMAVLFLALQSPLDRLGDEYLLSLHMTQHLLLVLVVPPLLLYGTPDWVVRPLVGLPVVSALAHLPNFFDLTLQNQDVHIVEHLLFIATGILAWWPVLSPLRELPSLSYPFQMLYLFLQTLPCSLVGALITLSGDVLYTPYAAAPRIWHSTVMGDQQIAGLIMWIGGSLYYFLGFMVVFFVWAYHEEPDRPRLYIVKGT